MKDLLQVCHDRMDDLCSSLTRTMIQSLQLCCENCVMQACWMGKMQLLDILQCGIQHTEQYGADDFCLPSMPTPYPNSLTVYVFGQYKVMLTWTVQRQAE